MSRAAPAAAPDPIEVLSTADGTGYLADSARPLTSLAFILPFVLLYELGTRLLLTDPVQGTQQIVAFTLLQRFFALLGATGRYLPGLTLAAILIAWHVARKDRWRVSFPTLLFMVVESVALALPLIIFGMLLPRLLPMSAPVEEGLGETIILSLGAGVYEELVFRLILCTALAILLKNGLRLKPQMSMLLLVLLSASLFSAYHYLGNETFHWQVFVFRMVAGVYFAALFVFRGFGITSGSHIAYDVIAAIF